MNELLTSDSNQYYICCGMKRSGSTLQYNLARTILEIDSPDLVVLGYVDGDDLPQLLTRSEYRGKRILLKSHDVQKARELAHPNVQLLYTYRDIRDVYLSGKIKVGWSFETLDDVMSELRQSFKAAQGCDNILIQRYEELFLNPAQGVRQIAEHLGISLDAANAAAIAQQNQATLNQSTISHIYLMARNTARQVASKSSLVSAVFNPLRKLNKVFFLRFAVDPKTQLHIDHISSNSGNPGAWKSQLSPDEQKKINTEYRDLLSEMGYPVGT